ncbi:MAG: hypothetical protein WDA60_14570 [Acidimicrobiia bacterium]|jgi:hypothetical protein
MGRVSSFTSAVVLATLSVAVLATGASAQRTPVTTAPRTTIPTVSPQAGTYPVLQQADLPNGYQMSSGTPQRRTGFSASYPTIDKCIWNPSNPFSGLTPVVYSSLFSRTSEDNGLETLWEFDDATPAKAFYGNLEKAYTAATKCKVVKQPSSAGSSSTFDIGTFSKIDAATLGDESLVVALEPASKLQPATKYAFFRVGSSVAAMRITDDSINAKEFTALAKTAAKRAG